MDNPYPPLVFLGSHIGMEFEAGLESADDIYAAVQHRVRIVEGIKGSEGELVTQLSLLLEKYQGLMTHIARTGDSITIGVSRGLA